MNILTTQAVSKTNPGSLLKLALLQLFGTAVFSLVLYYCFDTREALSAFFGGLVAVLASVFFAGRLFTSAPTLEAGEILIRFYVSVVLKAVFTLAMMGMFIVVIKVSILPFIIAFLLAAVIVNLLFLYIDANTSVMTNSK